jgi:molybdopterin/thiamine biosynthesis adenylyltransferase/rhodanese-related sulfurtransferase
VVIVGVGGLGNVVATQLAGAGVGKLVLIDHDVVDVTNLHRQTLFSEGDVGRAKATVAAGKLQQLNSTISIVSHSVRLTPSNVAQLCAGANLIIDAADNFAVSYLLSDYCWEQQSPLLSASVNRTFGYVGVFCAKAPSLRAAFPRLPLQQTSCDTVGVTGPSVGIVGSIQAQEALKALLGKSSLKGKLLYLDLWNYSQQLIDLSKAAEPSSPTVALIDERGLSEADFVVDVRESHETESCPQSFSVNACLPLADILAREYAPLVDDPSNARIVCCCRSGQRAMLAAQTLSQHGYTLVSALLPD